MHSVGAVFTSSKSTVNFVDLRIVKKGLAQVDTVKWENLRSQKVKLRYYNLFKADFETEHYLTSFLSKKSRSYYAQFRAGILPLMVETARFQGIPLEQRLCQLCKNNVGDFIECEFHLLCECVHYTSLRLSLFRKVTRKWPEFGNLDLFDKFIFLNENAQMYTANFVALAMEIRKTRLYNTST